MLKRAFRTPLAVFCVIAAAALTGCGGHGVSAVPHTTDSSQKAGAPRAFAESAAQAGSLFHPNSEKYSDQGSHPVTGRSGSAVIQSRALLAKDGTTLVEATTGTIDGAAGAGNIRHLTLTPATVDGVEQTTLAYNNLKAGGYWSHTYSGFAHNESLKVNTNVTDLDPRTDAVTTLDTVKLRPDLAAINVVGPAKAYTKQQVSFTTDVSELNGDVGARAGCILSVNGQQVDAAHGIWVDASGHVSCGFQTSFATPGSYNVSVTVANVVPGDWDTSNNTAHATIEIVDPIVHLNTYGSALSYLDQWSGQDSYTGSYAQYTQTWGNRYNESSAYISGYEYGQQFQFPVKQFTATVTSDGSPVVQLAPQTFAQDGYGCSQSFAPGEYATVCAYEGFTGAWAAVYGTDVTYFAGNVVQYCSQYWNCQGDSYMTNYHDGGPAFVLGNTAQFAIDVTDSAGTLFTGTTQTANVGGHTYDEPYSQCGNYYGTLEQYCYNEDYKHSEKTVYANSY